MQLEAVPVDLQEEFEVLRRTRGWAMLTRHIRTERDNKVGALISAKAGDSVRIAELQSEIRVYDWLLGDALSQIEASMTKGTKK